MNIYKVVAKVDQIVTREIHLTVEANSEEEAEEKSTLALKVYPEPIDKTLNIKNIVTVKQHHWIPKSVEVKSIKSATQRDQQGK